MRKGFLEREVTGSSVSRLEELQEQEQEEHVEQVEDPDSDSEKETLEPGLEFLGWMVEMLVLISGRLLNRFPSTEDLLFSDFLMERGRVMMG